MSSRRLTLALTLALSASAGAGQSGAPGPMLGDKLRYPHATLPARLVADLVAIPAGIASWDAADWTLFAGTATMVGFLMMPPSPSPDVRVQRWVRQVRGGAPALVWTKPGDVAVWTGIGAALVGSAAWGAIAERSEPAEVVSLVAEVCALSQVAQLGIKLVLGREGPTNADGLGVIRGPAAGYRLLPAGTPSGHAVTLYAILAVVERYWDEPVLSVTLHAIGLFLAAALVTDDYHFVSDVVWGAVMGYGLGRWVVNHRSSRYTYSGRGPVRVGVGVPPLGPAPGLAVYGTF